MRSKVARDAVVHTVDPDKAIAFVKERRPVLGTRPLARHTKILGRPLRIMGRFAPVIHPTLETRVEPLVVTAHDWLPVQ
jgi:hypothetical protein